MLRVYTSGIWDLVHVSHVDALKRAKSLGDYLIVGVISDEDAAPYKRHPIIPFDQRLEMISNFGFVDEAIHAPLTSNMDEDFYKKHKIDIHCQGEDDPKLYALPKRLGIMRFIGRSPRTSTTEIVARSGDEPTYRKILPVEESDYNVIEKAHGGYWKYSMVDFRHARNYHFPSMKFFRMIRENIEELICSYGSSQKIFDEKVSRIVGCDPANIVLLNGCSQIFPWFKSNMSSKRALIPTPTFMEFDSAFPNAETYKDWVGIDIKELDHMAGKSDIVSIVNPNVPTGTVIPNDEIVRLADRHPDVMFVVDESFIDFSDEIPLATMLLDFGHVKNVLVQKSFSKPFGVSGLRLGFAFSNDTNIINALRKTLPIWNVNSIGEFFLEHLIDFEDELEASFVQSKKDRKELADWLSELPGVLEVYQSGGNFLLTKLDSSVYPPGNLCRILLNKYNIYVHDTMNRLPQDATYLRFSVRVSEDNRRLVDALRREGEG